MDILRDDRLLAVVQFVNCGCGWRERELDLDAGISGGSGRGMRYGDIALLRSSECRDSEKSQDVFGPYAEQ